LVARLAAKPATYMPTYDDDHDLELLKGRQKYFWTLSSGYERDLSYLVGPPFDQLIEITWSPTGGKKKGIFWGVLPAMLGFIGLGTRQGKDKVICPVDWTNAGRYDGVADSNDSLASKNPTAFQSTVTLNTRQGSVYDGDGFLSPSPPSFGRPEAASSESSLHDGRKKASARGEVDAALVGPKEPWPGSAAPPSRPALGAGGKRKNLSSHEQTRMRDEWEITGGRPRASRVTRPGDERLHMRVYR
ncbi:hypothetical protein L249_1441, partial [Ophiocordyceps polyrhachis-furcata BCC 54312]